MHNAMTTVRLVVLVALLGAVSAIGCENNHAQTNRLFQQWNAKIKEAADLLETVQDVASAKAAAPQLTSVMQDLHQINEKLEISYDPEGVDFGDSLRVTQGVGEAIAQMQRLDMEGLRVGKDPELRAALGEAWNLLPAKAMMEAQGELPPSP
jgi:hypothetical protein